MGDSDSRKNLAIESVGKQCSRLLEDNTECASQEILKNKWGMGENDKGKAGSVLEEGQGPGEPSSPIFHSHVFGCCAGVWA